MEHLKLNILLKENIVDGTAGAELGSDRQGRTPGAGCGGCL